MKHTLTDRERELLEQVSTGKRNKEIAGELFITENTVETHLKTIFKKLGVRNRIEAICRGGEKITESGDDDAG